MIVVSGGAGFIGSAFLAKLNQEGIADILVVDSLGTSDKWKNLSGKRFIDYMHKDRFLKLVKDGAVDSAVKTVVHLGACSSTTEKDADYMMSNNYLYSKLLAQWALKKSIRFIYASSAATYGDGALGFSDADSHTPELKPLNVYALSKQLFDFWALKTGALNKMAGIKFFNVYGPNEYHKESMRSVVHKAFEQMKTQGHIKLFKSYHPDYRDGEQKRDFIYVKDCTESLYKLVNKPKVCGLFNLGTGSACSWNELAAAVCQGLGVETKIEYIDMPEELRGKYQYFTQAQMAKLSEAGCAPEFHSLEMGVKDYVQNYLSASDPYL